MIKQRDKTIVIVVVVVIDGENIPLKYSVTK